MSRLAREHITEKLTGRFPGADVTVLREPDGGLRIKVNGAAGGTMVAITGSEPSAILEALMTPRR